MRSGTLKRSSPSAGTRSIDRRAVEEAVVEWAVTVRKEHPEIVRIIWFGSWTGGIPSPGSDVDVCIVLSWSGKPFRERIPDFLPVGFPVGMDVFPYTIDEFKTLEVRSPEWYRAVASGKDV